MLKLNQYWSAQYNNVKQNFQVMQNINFELREKICAAKEKGLKSRAENLEHI